ncbi:MAG: DUF3623 family protein [Burkholderiaceae bacterium]
MSQYVFPVTYTLFVWWFSTGVILVPQRPAALDLQVDDGGHDFRAGDGVDRTRGHARRH